VTAVERLGSLDRTAVRAHAEYFSDARMVDAYLAAYQAVLLGERGPGASGGVQFTATETVNLTADWLTRAW